LKASAVNIRMSILATLVMLIVSDHTVSANDRSAFTKLAASACAVGVDLDGVEYPTPYAKCASDRTDWMQRIKQARYSSLEACFMPLVPLSKIAEMLE
jgi:hypothetical protein